MASYKIQLKDKAGNLLFPAILSDSSYVTLDALSNALSPINTKLAVLSDSLSDLEGRVTALEGAVSGKLTREIVEQLPTQDISTTTIYMVLKDESNSEPSSGTYYTVSGAGASEVDGDYYPSNQTSFGKPVYVLEPGDYKLLYSQQGPDKYWLIQNQDNDFTFYLVRSENITDQWQVVEGAVQGPAPTVTQHGGASGNNNVYTEYMYINNKWEIIGDTAVSLDGYITESDAQDMIDQALSNALAAYVTEEDLSDALSGYAKTTDLSGYAPINSPAFTGTPKAPNLTAESSDSNIANKAYVDALDVAIDLRWTKIADL